MKQQQSKFKQSIQAICQRQMEIGCQYDRAAAEFADDPKLEMINRLKHDIKNSLFRHSAPLISELYIADCKIQERGNVK